MSDKIVNSQNSSYISLIPTTQTEFTQNGKMIFELDESLGYIKGRDSYLAVDVENTSNERWTFPNGVGASALIKRMVIYSRSTGQLLETLENYNQWCGIENQYMRDDFSHLQRMEGVGNPCFQYINGLKTSGDNYRNMVQLDPVSVENSMISPINADGKTLIKTTRRFCVPIKSGLFSRWWDDEKLCPVLNLGGLRIEMTFASNLEVCKRLGFAPNKPNDSEPEKVRSLLLDGIKCNDAAAADTALQTNESQNDGYFTSVERLGLVKGQKIKITGTTAAPAPFSVVKTINDLAVSATAGRVTVTLDSALGTTITGVKIYVDENSQPSYKVSNCELRVLQMVVPKDGMDKLAKPMRYEFTSYDQFLNTLPSGVLRHQVPLSSVASKAKSIFSVFMDSDEVTQESKTYYSGLGPTELNLNSVQLFINNKLYPLQEIDPRKNEDKPHMINELVKSLRAINKEPLNLGSNEGNQLEDYSNTFLYSRELARGDFVYNLQNAEPEIRLGFNATRASNNRINSFVFSKKVVDISPQGLMVEL